MGERWDVARPDGGAPRTLSCRQGGCQRVHMDERAQREWKSVPLGVMPVVITRNPPTVGVCSATARRGLILLSAVENGGDFRGKIHAGMPERVSHEPIPKTPHHHWQPGSTLTISRETRRVSSPRRTGRHERRRCGRRSRRRGRSGTRIDRYRAACATRPRSATW